MPYLKNGVVCGTKSVLEYIIYYYVSELQYQKVLLQKVEKSTAHSHQMATFCHTKKVAR